MGRPSAQIATHDESPADPTGRCEQLHTPSAGEPMPSRPAGGVLAWLFPRQHGAWSILLVGYLVGALAVDGRGGAVPWIVLVSTLAGFLGQHATVTALRARPSQRRDAVVAALGLNSLSVGLLATLILVHGIRPLLPVVAAGAVLAILSLLVQLRHRERTAWGELVGVLGLSSVVLIAAVSRAEALGPESLGLWLLALLYFAGSVFHVRFLVRNWRARREPLAQRLQAGWASVVYHSAALLIVVSLSALGWAPPWAAAALVPVAIKALWALRRGGDAPPVIRTLGLIELGHSLAFAACIVLIYRLANAA
ncbi:MAG: hypothetical protein FJX74_10775 [Armatimonadetes bacterium]|nr:hypothetical protein [Armatimonadota bacterium]